MSATKKTEIQGWPPRYLTKPSAAQLKASRGDQIINFAETLCRITEDSIAGNAGDLLRFRDWQKELTRHLFACNPDGTLKFRRALIGLPRKNGKSAWLSSIALEHLTFGINGSQIVSAASEKEQAKIVFNSTKRMIELEPELNEILKPFRDSIFNPNNGSSYRALSAEAYSKEGLNLDRALVDEVHALPDDKLYNVLSLAMGARKEPLLVGITTAGVKYGADGQDSLCYSLYNYGKKVASGEIIDPTFFMAWWEADEKDDYRDPKIWRKANPGLDSGILSEADLVSSVSITQENEFRTKRLNQWVSAATAWLPQGLWDSLKVEKVVEDGAAICVGFDGSYNGDATVLIGATIEETPHIFPLAIWEKPDGDDEWKVPVQDVEAKIRDICKQFNVQEIVCDTYRWARTFEILEEEGLPIVAYPQNATRMTPATAKFYEACTNATLSHNGDPKLSRHIANATLRTDSRGSMLSKDKKGSVRRIDAAVAAVMAFDRATWYFIDGIAVPQIFDPWSEEFD
jgi:phage terminase large subunit-like protein